MKLQDTCGLENHKKEKRKRVAIITAIITGGLALIGVIITNISNNKKIETTLRIQQAITDTKIDELTREVRLHNNFAQKIPVLEEQIKELKEQIRNLEKQKGDDKQEKSINRCKKLCNNIDDYSNGCIIVFAI